MEKCEPKIDPEELLEVEIVLQKLAFFRCVHENFMDGCGNYILEAVQSMLMQEMPNIETPTASPMSTPSFVALSAKNDLISSLTSSKPVVEVKSNMWCHTLFSLVKQARYSVCQAKL